MIFLDYLIDDDDDYQKEEEEKSIHLIDDDDGDGSGQVILPCHVAVAIGGVER